jgi:signal transduction histidine kinase
MDFIREAITECRTLTQELRPEQLDTTGLGYAIHSACILVSRTCPGMRISEHVGVDEKIVPERLRIVIFRIVQEALTNIQKHAGCVRVSVSLTKGAAGLELAIQDSGRGFDPAAAPRSSFGLGIMRERAHGSGGVFAIQSAPGQGTKVSVIWKMEGEDAFPVLSEL